MGMSSGSEIEVDLMRRALELAVDAERKGEVPVGAVLVDREGRILAEAANAPIGRNDPTAHAEILVLRAAGQVLDNYRLPGTSLYVTLEPCPMCASAIVHARVETLVFGAYDPKSGACGSVMNLLGHESLNHRVDVTGGLLGDQASEMLKRFFKARR
jgi:tRNA(adenine34) deaminase